MVLMKRRVLMAAWNRHRSVPPRRNCDLPWRARGPARRAGGDVEPVKASYAVKRGDTLASTRAPPQDDGRLDQDWNLQLPGERLAAGHRLRPSTASRTSLPRMTRAPAAIVLGLLSGMMASAGRAQTLSPTTIHGRVLADETGDPLRNAARRRRLRRCGSRRHRRGWPVCHHDAAGRPRHPVGGEDRLREGDGPGT